MDIRDAEDMGLVMTVFGRHFKYSTKGLYVTNEDVIQEGYIALMKAKAHFVDEGKVSFSTFAFRYVRDAMWKYITSTKGPVKLSYRTVSKNKFEHFSIDLPLKNNVGGSSNTFADIFGAEYDFSESTVNDFLDSLTDQEKEILNLRMEEYSLKEIGERFGISRQAINQKINNIQGKWTKYDQTQAKPKVVSPVKITGGEFYDMVNEEKREGVKLSETISIVAEKTGLKLETAKDKYYKYKRNLDKRN